MRNDATQSSVSKIKLVLWKETGSSNVFTKIRAGKTWLTDSSKSGWLPWYSKQRKLKTYSLNTYFEK